MHFGSIHKKYVPTPEIRPIICQPTIILHVNSFECDCNSTGDYSRGYQTDQIRMANDLLNPQKSKIEIEFHWASGLPLHRRMVQRIHDEYLTGFSQMERHTASLERDKEYSDLWILGKSFDCSCTGRGRHMSIQFDTNKPSTTNPPLNQIQETRKLRKHNRLSSDDIQESKSTLIVESRDRNFHNSSTRASILVDERHVDISIRLIILPLLNAPSSMTSNAGAERSMLRITLQTGQTGCSSGLPSMYSVTHILQKT